MYTLDYTLEQLERLHDRIDSGQPIQIIHILLDDEDHMEDHYFVLIDCEPRLYTLLAML